MDWPLIEQKLESLRRSIQRVKEKCPDNAAALGNDYDAQDIFSPLTSPVLFKCVWILERILLLEVSTPRQLPWEKRSIFYLKQA